MKRRPGNRIEGAMVGTSLGSLLRPLFYFLYDVSYPQSVDQFRVQLPEMNSITCMGKGYVSTPRAKREPGDGEGCAESRIYSGRQRFSPIPNLC